MTLLRLPIRWLAAGGATALAAVLGVALLLQTGSSAACAAPALAAAPPDTAGRTGKATYYDLGKGMGNCSFEGTPADGLYVALGNSEYADAAACGTYLEVTTPKGSVVVKVIDRCPECEKGHIDLSRKAFGRIADHVTGIVEVDYKTVPDPGLQGGMTVRIKEGASQWWFAARIDNHGTGLESVKVKSTGGAWRTAKRMIYNYWLVNDGAGPGPFTLRVTDVSGRTATVTGVALRPEVTQRTNARFGGSAGTATGAGTATSGSRAVPAKKPSAAASPSSAASPSPSASASPQVELLGESAAREPSEVPVAQVPVADTVDCG